MKKGTKRLCLFLSVPFILSSIGYGSWVINTKEENIVVSDPKVEDIPVAYIVGKPDVKYTKIEKALDVAKDGDIVCVIPPEKANYNDQTNPDEEVDNKEYEISSSCVIKKGVTLLIPTDKNSISGVTDKKSLDSYIKSQQEPSRNQGSDGYGSFATSKSALYLRVTVKINENVTLVNNGTIVVSGYLSGGTNNGGVIGQTSHSYSRIVLAGNASLVQGSDYLQDGSTVQGNENASIYCFGYIDEEKLDNKSSLDLQKGHLYLPLLVYDYRGFVYSYAMTAGAIDDERCSAFNDIGVRNVSVQTKVAYSARVHGIVNVYVKYDSRKINETIPSVLGLVGNDSSFLIQQNSSDYSYLSFKCNASTGNMHLDFYGGNVLNNFNLELKLMGVSLSLSTAKAFFPISYKMSLTFNKGENNKGEKQTTTAVYDFSKQRVKFLPGSSAEINENVKISGNELSIYSAFFDGNNGAGQGVSNCGRLTYPSKTSAKFVLKNGSSLSFNSIGGNIYCDDSSSVSVTNKSLISKEPWTLGDNSGGITPPWKIVDYLLIKEQLQIVPIAYLDKKKIDVSVNSFESISSFEPSISIETGEMSDDISGFQKVVFYDSINTFFIKLVKDIYRVFYNNSFYKMNSVIAFKNSENVVSITSSKLSISNNNEGVDEFEVQNIEIIGSTHEIEKDTVLQLDKEIDDINKSYDKNYVWSSLNESIATIDKNGIVKGVGVGNTSIKLTCGSKESLYEIKVVEPATTIKEIKSIVISGPKTESESYVDGDYTFNATLYGDDETTPLSLDDILSITWTIKPVADDRGYLNGDKNVHSVDGTLSVKVTLAGGMHANSNYGDADKVKLTCIVVDKKGNELNKLFTITNDNADNCLLPTAKVLMADGSYKLAGDIRTGDMVMSFNHETGRLEPNVVIVNDDIGKESTTYDVIHLLFGNGNSTDFIYEHGYFDLTLNKYVYMHEDDVDEYIGHEFVHFDKNGNYQRTKLVKCEIKKMFTSLCSPVTANHLNIVADDMLSIGGGITGLFNIFEYDPLTLAFDKELMQQDISKYGLLGYEHFEKYFPREIYDLLPCKYMAVSIGKGLIAWKTIESYIYRWKGLLLGNA